MGAGRSIVVTSPTEKMPSYSIVDVPLITELEVHGVKPNGSE